MCVCCVDMCRVIYMGFVRCVHVLCLVRWVCCVVCIHGYVHHPCMLWCLYVVQGVWCVAVACILCVYCSWELLLKPRWAAEGKMPRDFQFAFLHLETLPQ